MHPSVSPLSHSCPWCISCLSRLLEDRATNILTSHDLLNPADGLVTISNYYQPTSTQKHVFGTDMQSEGRTTALGDPFGAQLFPHQCGFKNNFSRGSSVLFLLQPSFQRSLSMASGAVQNHFCGYPTYFSSAFHFFLFQFVHSQQIYLNLWDISGKLKRKTLCLFRENKEKGTHSAREARWLFKILILIQKAC